MSLINTPANTAINQDGIDAVHDQAQGIITDTKNTISTTQDQIDHDYDGFLSSIQTTLVSDNTETSSLGTPLFTANTKIIDTVKTQQNPSATYLELNKKVMDGFGNALQTHSAADLNMSLLTYNETKNYVNKTREAVDN